MSVTETFPSWFIGRYPDKRVIEVSYGSLLAEKFGRANRRKIEEFGKELFNIEISPENRSVTNWGIKGRSGGMISTGVSGYITGHGADLLIIDDPIKNRAEAESTTYRERLWDEWRNTLLTRLHPGAAIIVILTRWHEDDLAGRILKNSDEWTEINLPAVAGESDDILGRLEGEALWPEHGFDEVWAGITKKNVGSRTWESLYQGRPAAEEGNLFKAEGFRRFRMQGSDTFELVTDSGLRVVERASCKIFQTCDVAGSTKSSADYFVNGTFAVTPHNELLVLDIFRTRLEGPDQPKHMHRLFHEWKPLIQGVESKNMGLTLYQQLLRDGLPIVELKADSDKFSRALPAAARYEAGTVFHLDGAHWLDALESELLQFPTGRHDDQVDVVAYAVQLQTMGYLSDRENRNRALIFG